MVAPNVDTIIDASIVAWSAVATTTAPSRVRRQASKRGSASSSPQMTGAVTEAARAPPVASHSGPLTKPASPSSASVRPLSQEPSSFAMPDAAYTAMTCARTSWSGQRSTHARPRRPKRRATDSRSPLGASASHAQESHKRCRWCRNRWRSRAINENPTTASPAAERRGTTPNRSKPASAVRATTDTIVIVDPGSGSPSSSGDQSPGEATSSARGSYSSPRTQ